MHILKNTHYDFLRWRWHAIAVSWIIIIAGIVTMVTRGIPKGVEFAGGTVIITKFDQVPSIQQVRTALDRSFPGGGENLVVQSYGAPTLQQLMIRVPHVGAEAGASLSAIQEQMVNALKQANLGNFTVVGTEIVGPAVGRELTSRALWAFGLSLIGILAYLAFRF